MTVQPSIVIEDLALPCSLAHYVVEQSRTSMHLDTASNGCLEAGLKALGMARLTQMYTDAATRSEARRLYMQALHLTNSALRSKSGAHRDSTLLTANVLSIFEAVMSLHRSFDEWSTHINGAATLLYLRGDALFQTTTGGRLFMQTTASLTLSCLTQRQPIPPHMLELHRRAERYIVDPSEMPWQYQLVSMKVANLQSETLIDSSPKRKEDAEDILRRALEIDDEFENLFRNPPPAWQYTVVPSAPKGLVFSDHYHVYSHFLCAQAWNGMRGSRLMLRNIMKQAIATGGPELLSGLSGQDIQNLQSSPQVVHDLQLAILATVPQQLDQSLAGKNEIIALLRASNPHSKSQQPGVLHANFGSFGGDTVNPFRRQRQIFPDIPRVQLSGGYILQWSLFIAARSDAPGGKIRVWVVDVLRMMGKTLGIQQALVIANMLEADSDLPVRT